MIHIVIKNGIRFTTTSCAMAAAYVVNNNLADVIVLRADTKIETLESVMDLMGGGRESGPFKEIRDIRIDPAKSLSIAESSAEHPLHTDGSFDANPPSIFLLQVVKADPQGGGENTFVGLESMMRRMPEEYRHALEAADISFSRSDDSGRHDAAVAPILYPREWGGVGFRWRDDHQVQPVVVDGKETLIQDAIHWIRGYVANRVDMRLMGEPGDIIVVVNDRVLHGRTALSSKASERWVRRAWIRKSA